MTIKLAVNSAQKIDPHQLFSPGAYISSSEMLAIILVIHALTRAWHITLAYIPEQIGQVKFFFIHLALPNCDGSSAKVLLNLWME